MKTLLFQSVYSFFSSTLTIDKAIAKAKSSLCSSLLIADINNIYGAIELIDKASKNDFIPHIGMQFKLPEIDLLLVAKNNNGLKSLSSISTLLNDKTVKKLTITEDFFNIFYDLFIIINKFNYDINLINKNMNELFLSTTHNIKNNNDFKTINYSVINASTDVEYSFINVLHCIKKDIKVDNLKEKAYFNSTIKLDSFFNDLLKHSTVNIDFNINRLPKYTNKKKEISALDLIYRICYKRLKELKLQNDKQYLSRFKYELNVIKEMEFLDYFLIIWDAIDFCKKNNIIVGPGRGSATGSLISFLLNITTIDPIKNNLIFERFLNPSRKTLPDIDVDIEDKNRYKLLIYLRNKYQDYKVSNILTFNTFGTKSSIREVAKAYGLSQKYINEIIKKIKDSNNTIEYNLKNNKELMKIVYNNNILKKIFEYSMLLEGMPRTSSIHASGVVFIENDFSKYLSFSKYDDNTIIVQNTMEYCEKLGLLKVDFLGLKNLTLLRNIVSSFYNGDINYFIENKFPYNDKMTYQLLSNAHTIGIFQLESYGIRKLIKSFKPNNLQDLATVLALYRPGPMKLIDEFLLRKYNKKKYNIPLVLKENLFYTYGIIIYQEQVMDICKTLAGMNMKEADNFRRAISKKDSKLLSSQKKIFIQGVLKKGFTQKTASKIFSLIEEFASYGFNKSHALGYAKICYQMAYLKTHYPCFFMNYLMNSVLNSDKKIFSYFCECKNIGIKILPININKSFSEFIIYRENSIIMGFDTIIGMPKNAIDHILEIRKQGFFKGIEDFLRRINRKIITFLIIEKLINAFAFSIFDKNQRKILNYCEKYYSIKSYGLDILDLKLLDNDFNIKQTNEDYSLKNRQNIEKKTIGFIWFTNPLYNYKFTNENFSEINDRKNYTVSISEIKEVSTVYNDTIAYIKIFDMCNSEQMIFIDANLYEKIKEILKVNNVYIMSFKIKYFLNNKIKNKKIWLKTIKAV